MKSKLFITAAALILGLGCSITASASPRVVSYGFVFDPQFYAETNPDVVASLGLDMEFVETGLEDDNLAQHYVDSGIAEGRVPYFDAVFYAAANPDVAALYGTDAQALYRQSFPERYVLWEIPPSWGRRSTAPCPACRNGQRPLRGVRR